MEKRFCYLVIDSYDHVQGVCDTLPVAEKLLQSMFAFDEDVFIQRCLF